MNLKSHVRYYPVSLLLGGCDTRSILGDVFAFSFGRFFNAI